MLLMIFGLVFGAVALAAHSLMRPGDNSISRRTRPDGGDARLVRGPQGSFSKRVIRPAIARVGHGLARLLPQNILASINRRISAADDPVSLPTFLFAWLVFSGSGLALLFYAILSSESLTPLQGVALSVVALPLIVLLPWAWLRHKAKARQKQIVRALPDGLDLLVTCVEAGIGVDSAFALVAEETEGALSDALRLYLRQVGLGRSRRQALTHVADRTGVQDLITLAASVSQGEELGTSIGDVLRRQAADLRALRKERAQTAAQRAPVLMTMPLILCFLPAMGIVIVVPSILSLVDFFQGIGA